MNLPQWSFAIIQKQLQKRRVFETSTPVFFFPPEFLCLIDFKVQLPFQIESFIHFPTIHMN
jgi:hypothetical protein